MNRSVFLIFLLLAFPAHAEEPAEKARADLEQVRDAIEHCDGSAPLEEVNDLLATLDDELSGIGIFVHFEQRKLQRGLWHFTFSYNGQGRWLTYSSDHYLFDTERCAWVRLYKTGVASSKSGSAEYSSHGESQIATQERLLRELDTELGSSTEPNHGMARFLFRISQEKLENSDELDMAGLVPEAEWISGKPLAQPRTYWPARQAWVTSIPAPKLWKKSNRYHLYRYDGGQRFRRGSAAVAVYDPKKNRHAWVLVTPLPAAEGHLRFVGTHNELSFCVTETDVVQNLFVIDHASGRTFLVRDSARGGVALEDGTLLIQPSEPMRVDVEALRESMPP